MAPAVRTEDIKSIQLKELVAQLSVYAFRDSNRVRIKVECGSRRQKLIYIFVFKKKICSDRLAIASTTESVHQCNLS